MDAQQLGAFVRAARIRAGVSGTTLANRINHSSTWVYRVETGDRAAPSPEVLNSISTALSLAAWERWYMFLLAGEIPTYTDPIDGARVGPYIDVMRGPAAWIDHHGGDYLNDEFRRLFKGVETARDIVHWHFEDPRAREVINNWDEIADWWIATRKYRMAVNPDDPNFAAALRISLEIPEFARRWNDQIIPVDPRNRIWQVRDLDNGVELAVDMRVWRNYFRNGALLIGVVVS